MVQIGLGDGHNVGTLIVNVVAHADRDPLPTCEHVKLGEEQVGHRINHDRLLHYQRVKPATATRTLGRDTVLTTLTAQPLTVIVTELGRERTFTNASGVRLSDANNAVDASRSNA